MSTAPSPTTARGPSTSRSRLRRAGGGGGAVRKLLIWRVPLGILSVLFVAVLTYVATQVLPGDAATSILGFSVSDSRGV